MLKAEDVQMGTRMLTSLESAVHDEFAVLLDVLGNPNMRVLRTGLAARVSAADPDARLLGQVTELYCGSSTCCRWS